MAEPTRTLGSICFGRFELSAETGELRKDGVRLKLAGQAIQVLAMLAANPGELVTREDLQQKLWPGASYGDPEHGLNAAVNKLRESPWRFRHRTQIRRDRFGTWLSLHRSF
jgi:DNA-binding winged helix-turn-helix (wHTH) protein